MLDTLLVVLASVALAVVVSIAVSKIEDASDKEDEDNK